MHAIIPNPSELHEFTIDSKPLKNGADNAQLFFSQMTREFMIRVGGLSNNMTDRKYRRESSRLTNNGCIRIQSESLLMYDPVYLGIVPTCETCFQIRWQIS